MSATETGPALTCPGCGSPDVDLRCGLFCGTCAAAVAEEAGDGGQSGQAHYAHKECGGITIWDLSGGFCLKCHAEGLDLDDVERQEAAP